ncbi:hypothetical protein ATY81_09185 [Rhizobium sp. R72]|uniref:hypothetical protein n=1 Tax=unclassified Rhizobium TaxID=2613769 RepID=UPI000B537471|nr:MULTISPECIES: hypothetical protein [unclassified Rhizobium]OWV84705.1 hypothetical protein ATY79_12025 [Rhizobium sp. R693]OWV97578.1 hypothetical protein ATY81_09185 [Rhizobium sp. R72]OWV97917.1 hypothetical protein ATY80_09185 [Rhizobium sp. R711]
MPRLIWFILTRFMTGFALGCATGLWIWNMYICGSEHGMALSGSLIAQVFFTYLFASTMGIGYMATALWTEEL